MLRRILITIPMLALAVFAGSVAIASAFKYQNPPVAILFWPSNGLAETQLAKVQFQLNVAQAPKANPENAVTAQVTELAMDGYSREPLANGGLSLLGLALDKKGEQRQARMLLRHATLLTKRDDLTNAWLMQDYSRSGDIRGMLRYVDISSRVNPATAGVYAKIMVPALQQPSTWPIFHDILQRHPSWEKDFWNAAVANEAALDGAAKLRQTIYSEDEQAIDANLLQRLVGANKLASAAELVDARLGGSKAIVKNGDFTQQPTLPPFDWSLVSTGSFGAFIDTEKKALIASAISGATGEVASEIVQIPPGRYQLSASRAANYGGGEGSTTIRLACSADGTGPSFPIVLGSGTVSRLFDTGADCRFAKLSVYVEAESGLSNYDVGISSISIAPAN